MMVENKTVTVEVGSTQRALRMSVARWELVAMGAVLFISLFLNFFRLGQNGYANLYYAAAVKSMSMSWHNFFFVAFDPGGFVSVDKPPLAFWLQVGSARLFGLSPWSVMLPQALAGVLSVLLLAFLVRRTFGPVAGVLAAATLALTPISVVANRNNTMDSVLVLVLLLAAWAGSVAAERGKWRFLLLSVVLVGVGFNIKMLSAYTVLPALALLYWFSAPYTSRKRLLHLALAAGVLVAVSFCWAVAVDLTPAAQRPFVGSSTSNSEVQLSLLYNGVSRFTDLKQAAPLLPPEKLLNMVHDLPEFIAPIGIVGNPGLLRLVTLPMAGQIGLFIPLAILGLVGVEWDKPSLWPLNRQQQGLALWGIWFLTQLILFSSASVMHQYYTALMAPAICALLAIGVVTTWRATTSALRRWFLPAAFLLACVVHVTVLSPHMATWGWYLMVVVCISAVCAALLMRFTSPEQRRALVIIGLCALLIVPTIWSAIPVLENRNDAFPYGGPDMSASQDVSTNRLEGLVMQSIQRMEPDGQMVAYLLKHQGRAHYLAATIDSTVAAPIIMDAGKPVMDVGGYAGSDQIISRARFEQLSRSGVVRFFILPQTFQEAHLDPAVVEFQKNYQALAADQGQANQDELVGWVRSQCTNVPELAWHSTLSADGSPLLDLYDCSRAGA